jgi:hypothetical protein
MERGRDGAHHPGVDGETVRRRRVVDLGLQRVGQADGGAGGARVAQVDGGARMVVVVGLGARRSDDELHLASAKTQIHRTGGEVARDLADGCRQGIQKHEPGGGIEAGGEPLGHLPGLVGAVHAGLHDLPLQVRDVLSEFHATTMTPLWCHVNTPWCLEDRVASRHRPSRRGDADR